MAENKELKCGDIIETPFGVMIIESINEDKIVGHKLGGIYTFITKEPKKVKVLNSDFRYKGELDSSYQEKIKKLRWELDRCLSWAKCQENLSKDDMLKQLDEDIKTEIDEIFGSE